MRFFLFSSAASSFFFCPRPQSCLSSAEAAAEASFMEYTVPLFPEGGRGEKEERKKSLRRGVLGGKGGRKRKEKRAGGISCSQKKARTKQDGGDADGGKRRLPFLCRPYTVVQYCTTTIRPLPLGRRRREKLFLARRKEGGGKVEKERKTGGMKKSYLSFLFSSLPRLRKNFCCGGRRRRRVCGRFPPLFLPCRQNALIEKAVKETNERKRGKGQRRK